MSLTVHRLLSARMHALCLLLLCVVWPVFARSSSRPASQESQSTPSLQRSDLELLAKVSETAMQERVRQFVALGPRMGGTRSGKRAADARVEAFESMKLPVRVIEGPERLCHEESEWTVVAKPKAGDAWQLESPWPWGFSPSAKGKVALSTTETDDQALLLERRPRGRIRKSPAVVLYDGETTKDGSYPVVRHLRSRVDNPYPVFGISSAEGERLRAQLAEGEVELSFDLTAEIKKAPPLTVVASLAARAGAKPGYLLFCAHGDSDAGGPGANDNGSGEAIVLEIARVLAEGVAQGTISAPAMEVRFAIWGSEIFSTRHFLTDVVAKDPDPILGVINYDQSGFGTGQNQLNMEPDDLPANRELIKLLAGCLESADGEHGLPERWATNKSLGGTDSYVFSSSDLFEEKGLPSITIFISAWDKAEEHPRTPNTPGESWSDRDKVHVDYDLYYHSAGDTPENTTDTEAWNMGWCARLGLLAVLRASAERE
ncbi:MAG: hypothetical protein ACI841_002757, partial [Planctomycetota bacterium]